MNEFTKGKSRLESINEQKTCEISTYRDFIIEQGIKGDFDTWLCEGEDEGRGEELYEKIGFGTIDHIYADAETITDTTMIRIILQGINQDIDNCQNLSVHNSFVKSEPFNDNKSCIAIYQANYDPAQDDSEECPDLSKYTYNIFLFNGSTLSIFKELSVADARAVYKGEGLKFWTDR